jgi:hypothetical protein
MYRSGSSSHEPCRPKARSSGPRGGGGAGGDDRSGLVGGTVTCAAYGS